MHSTLLVNRHIEGSLGRLPSAYQIMWIFTYPVPVPAILSSMYTRDGTITGKAPGFLRGPQRSEHFRKGVAGNHHGYDGSHDNAGKVGVFAEPVDLSRYDGRHGNNYHDGEEPYPENVGYL